MLRQLPNGRTSDSERSRGGNGRLITVEFGASVRRLGSFAAKLDKPSTSAAANGGAFFF
jgi:hypothetical protein